jgi:hypothetical protein
MRQVKILSGVSGSGKSTMAKKFRSEFDRSDSDGWLIVSADDYFIGKDGVYRFNPCFLGEAHAQCFRQFILALQGGRGLVVVDNTNTTVEEISPYILGANAFGYQAKVISLIPRSERLGDAVEILDVCSLRNLHGVPRHVLSAQHIRMCDRKLPSFWDEEVIPFTV